MSKWAQNDAEYNRPRYQRFDPHEEVIWYQSCSYLNHYTGKKEMILEPIVSMRMSNGYYCEGESDASSKKERGWGACHNWRNVDVLEFAWDLLQLRSV